ncbi:uncharacterized protein LOC144737754 [Lampetra planeri]
MFAGGAHGGLYDNVGAGVPGSRGSRGPHGGVRREGAVPGGHAAGPGARAPVLGGPRTPRARLAALPGEGEVRPRERAGLHPRGAVPLVLFGGEIGVRHRQRLVTVDGWIHFQAPARVGVIFRELRVAVDSVLERKMANPKLSQQDEPAIKLLLELIRSEAGSV